MNGGDRPLSHQEIEGLLGAFALDALDEDEWEAVDLHLRGCPRCRAEVAEHREVAALLAHTGSPAPEGVWDKILDELEPAPPAMRVPLFPAELPSTAEGPEPGARDVVGDQLPVPPGPPISVSRIDQARRSSLRTRALAVALAAAAVVVAVLGVVTIRQSQHLDTLDASLREVSVDRVASHAMSDPRAATGKLVSGDGRINAPVVVSAQGKGYLFASKLAELPRDRVYQLWGRVSGTTVSLGVFDGGTDIVQFQLGNDQRDNLNRLLVTEELAPGVPLTRHRAVVSGTV